MYKVLSDVPWPIRRRIEIVLGADASDWVARPIPALRNRTVLDALQEVDGELEILALLARIESGAM